MVEKSIKLDRATISKGGRNYQLDFLKLIFTFFVFLYHTRDMVGENTIINIPANMGWISVHVFFVISGLLMSMSIVQKYSDDSKPGYDAFKFVLSRFKGFALPYLVALIIRVVMYIWLNKKFSFGEITTVLVMAIPEAFAVNYTGLNIQINGPTWYISAMLVSMLPLAYFFIKKKDTFLYVTAPMLAFFTLGFMYQQPGRYVGQNVFYTFILGALIRAVCGLCFGVVAWLIYDKICRLSDKKSIKIILTITEILLYGLFLYKWYTTEEQPVIFSMLLLLPVAIAISFSQKSYISKLFTWKGFRFIGSFSLAIYLNHMGAKVLLTTFFNEGSYYKKLAIMIGLTLVLMLIYYFLIFLFKWMYKRFIKQLIVVE